MVNLLLGAPIPRARHPPLHKVTPEQQDHPNDERRPKQESERSGLQCEGENGRDDENREYSKPKQVDAREWARSTFHAVPFAAFFHAQ